ncbi:MAG: hypothetical protein JWO05_786 [Gemmatimonadetes bacterium]|nr:hypothetical protein [Gemmatimonadota bacterium]
MPRYIAFMRALNVGGRVIKMDELRAMFESLKLADVESFIASGNIIFTTKASNEKALEAKIEKHLEAELGYRSEVFLRTPAELQAIVDGQPFPDADQFTLHVMFLGAAPSADQKKALKALETPSDEFRVIGREAYWLCRVRFNETKVSPAKLAKALGPSTARNITTVRKLAAKYPQG